jgi:hypothetical protein
VSRRLVIAGVAGIAIAGAAVPSFASIGSPVTVDTSNGVRVGVWDTHGNVVAGGSVTPDGQACAGISKQIPVCTPAVGDAIGPIGTAGTAQSLPVEVRHDDQATGVSVSDVGVIRYSDGTICPIVSTQDWQCVRGDN